MATDQVKLKSSSIYLLYNKWFII